MPYADREARLAYLKEYRAKNPDTRSYSDRKDVQYRRLEQNRAYVRSVKEHAPCTDCGVNYPYYVMDFDHVRGEKHMNLSALVNRRASLDRIDEEIAKCDLVCANCHRIRTFTRTGEGSDA